MQFASLKGQERRIGRWNSPQITRMKRIFADFFKKDGIFSVKVRVEPSHQPHPRRIETHVIHKLASNWR